MGCRERPQLQVPRVTFGCATTFHFAGNGIVGLADAESSLINQIGDATSLGQRFSYCLAPFFSDVSSALNFGARATVTEPGAVTTPMVQHSSAVGAYYTVLIVSLRVGNTEHDHQAAGPVPRHRRLRTVLTYLDKELLDPIVEALSRSIKLPRKQSPKPKLFSLCYEAGGLEVLDKVFPDVTLELGGGASVTLKAENVFVDLLLRTVCLAMAPVTHERPVVAIGNIMQQNMHVGYDLDQHNITFAPADCTRSYPSPPAFVSPR
ncbi:hypothetical protein CFC21_075711 [Triticum aestivum]|uniref:Peptidase A1 domain-containing protein n=2 Tax=Triticum aestivum TaxID=4565 RepID=A0A9R1KXN0_WHEAT|nr:hypothetical protein CFC21_075711 [Triticum aestivum]